MCLTIPGKIVAINSGIAKVKNGGRTASVDLGIVRGAKIGDWILFATDRAVRKISSSDAKEIINLLEEHYPKFDNDKLPEQFKQIIYQIKKTNGKVLKGDIEYLLGVEDKAAIETLYAEANTLRKEKLEDFVCIHGIIEFSNYCKNNCLYCGIRHDSKIERYRMSEAEIIEIAEKAAGNGYKLLVLQSGEDDFYSDSDIINLVKKIRSRLKVFIFLSVGERGEKFYKQAKAAGASGSLFRFEASNSVLYKKMHPGKTLKDRLTSIGMQKSLGYYIASGSIIGLAGQTLSDIAADLLMIKKLRIPMISAGPYIPASGTPLAKIKNQKSKIKMLELALKYIAIARLMMPEIKIPVTTALETLDSKNGRHKGLLAGANALMFNLTPAKYCKKYQLYDNKFRDREKVWQKYGLFKGEESWEMIEDKLSIN